MKKSWQVPTAYFQWIAMLHRSKGACVSINSQVTPIFINALVHFLSSCFDDDLSMFCTMVLPKGMLTLKTGKTWKQIQLHLIENMQSRILFENIGHFVQASICYVKILTYTGSKSMCGNKSGMYHHFNVMCGAGTGLLSNVWSEKAKALQIRSL